MVKDYKKKVLKMAGGGYVDSEDKKRKRLDVNAESYPDNYGALPVTVMDRKTGKIDLDESLSLRGRNQAEGYFQELDRRYRTDSPMSKRFKTKDDRKKDQK